MTLTIDELLKESECEDLEFKESKFKLPKSFWETVCAFLNRDGGKILLGVNDAKEVTKAVGANGGVNGGVNVGVNFHDDYLEDNALINIMKLIMMNEANKAKEIATLSNVAQRTIERKLKKLKEQDFIFFEGVPKTGEYKLTEKGLKYMKRRELG